ncbi:hypothetical protein GLYMA_18G209650v4 [Glycine max]|nr:hypothetical protein GLYMA_18G209650v4 [Glycine max]KAH1155420.1 hypothetical protein GYH30_050647 [Glycine max]
MNTTRGVNSENHILFCFISPTREILLVSSSCAPLPHHDNSTLYILHLEMLKDEVCLASAQNSAPSFNGLCSILKKLTKVVYESVPGLSFRKRKSSFVGRT